MRPLNGVVPLNGRREQWMSRLLSDHATLSALLDEHGSPSNFLEPRLLTRNLHELVDAGEQHGVDTRIFYARKANKALGFVDEALRAGHGVDVAGERELLQVVERTTALGIPADRIILTAAVKPEALLERAVSAGVTVSIDNLDEWNCLHAVAERRGARVPIALRLRVPLPDRPRSRFGEEIATWSELLGTPDAWTALVLRGLHFHLDGYAGTDRITALDAAMDLADRARALGHEPQFVDIGGGVPMSYLDDASGWDEFWRRHRDAVAAEGDIDTMTWRNRALGSVYPAWQQPVRGSWLHGVLAAPSRAGSSIGGRLRSAGLRLHVEPGRSLLDGAGLTVARVVHRKRWPDDTLLVSLAMNRTQCRSAADDFLVDPLLVPAPNADRGIPGEGYLLGAYCIESELLTWRRLRFDGGVAVGDLVAWPNTAGYLMHILESASHQIPLAANLIRDDTGAWRRDDIDGWS